MPRIGVQLPETEEDSIRSVRGSISGSLGGWNSLGAVTPASTADQVTVVALHPVRLRGGRYDRISGDS